eukprot:TRINITY_DN26584_c0_g2_i1.p1 TRINITY_DN26584_c0_g2~~TRINITY_DN26584_c0_g2_i1.p1  ORF type:complete len:755 (+),score=91.37 TRINITY_DN26584_c0_g2_i1:62-2326(+)
MGPLSPLQMARGELEYAKHSDFLPPHAVPEGFVFAADTVTDVPSRSSRPASSSGSRCLVDILRLLLPEVCALTDRGQIDEDLLSGVRPLVLELQASIKRASSPESSHVELEKAARREAFTVASSTARRSARVLPVQEAPNRRVSVTGPSNSSKAFHQDPRRAPDKLLLDAFQQMDVDGNGVLSQEELTAGLQRCDLPLEKIKGVLQEVSRNEDGSIDFAAWRAVITSPTSLSSAKAFAAIANLKRQVQSKKDGATRGKTTSDAPEYSFMLRPDAATRIVWDTTLMIFCAYLAISLPYFLAFESHIDDDVLSSFASLHLAIDVMFLVDVVLNFRTGAYMAGHLVMDARRVAVHYLRTWFLIDLFSSVPFEELSNGVIPTFRGLKMLKLGKLSRVVRLLKPFMDKKEAVLDNLSGSSRLRRVLEHFAVVYSTSLLCHWLACGMAICSLDWLATYQDVGNSAARMYVAGLYWAMTTMTTVGYGDIVPTNDAERLFSIVGMVIGGAFYGYLIGTMTEIVAHADLNRRKFHERMSLVLSFVDHYKLPLTLRKRVLEFFRCVAAERSAEPIASLTAELSPDLLKEISSYLINPDIMYNKLFEGIPFNALIRVQSVAQTLSVVRGSMLVSEGDAGTAMFILTAGSLALECEQDDDALSSQVSGFRRPSNASRDSARHLMLSPGESFGEEVVTGLCENYRYDVIASEDSRMFMLEARNFVETFEYLPSSMRLMTLSAAKFSCYARLCPAQAQALLKAQDQVL